MTKEERILLDTLCEQFYKELGEKLVAAVAQVPEHLENEFLNTLQRQNDHMLVLFLIAKEPTK